MATYIPKWVGMRYETLIDDGVTGVIEWVHIVTDAGVSEGGRVCLSGIAAYMRNEDGLICSIRITIMPDTRKPSTGPKLHPRGKRLRSTGSMNSRGVRTQRAGLNPPPHIENGWFI
jgi:hypothetical protein